MWLLKKYSRHESDADEKRTINSVRMAPEDRSCKTTGLDVAEAAGVK